MVLRRPMAALLLGPGMRVRTIGPEGSSGKGEAVVVLEEPLVGEGAVAEAVEAYCLWTARGVGTTAGRVIVWRRAGLTHLAVRRNDAILFGVE
jgi:hypothetical protein